MTRRFREIALSASMAIGLMMASGQAQAEEDTADHISAAFDAQMDAGFTGYVIVVRGDEVIFSRGAGVANAITEEEMHETTQFDIASITKTVTGALVAEEIAAGRLSAEIQLQEILDVAGTHIAEITIHQLLTHSAGLVGAVGDDEEEISLNELVARAAREPLLYPPGARYRYSNVGYSLLGAVLERVSNLSLEEQTTKYLQKIGAVATGYEGALDPSLSITRENGNTVRELSWGGHAPGANLLGNGGMVSTAADMVRWILAYRDGAFVSAAARDIAWTPYVDETGEGYSFYGYGLVVEKDEKLGPIYWHNGGGRHFNAHWRLIADPDVLIIAMSDQPPAPADRMVLALQRAMFE